MANAIKSHCFDVLDLKYAVYQESHILNLKCIISQHKQLDFRPDGV